MSDIGGENCNHVRGTVSDLKERAQFWQFPGHDTYGAQQLGLGDTAFVVRAVLFGTYAAVLTWAQNIYAKQGTIVSVTNDRGTTFTNCLLISVPPVKTSTAHQPGTTNTTRGEIEIKGVKTN